MQEILSYPEFQNLRSKGCDITNAL